MFFLQLWLIITTNKGLKFLEWDGKRIFDVVIRVGKEENF